MSYGSTSHVHWETDTFKNITPPPTQVPAGPPGYSFMPSASGLTQSQSTNPLILMQRMELELHNAQQEKERVCLELSTTKAAFEVLQESYSGLLEVIKNTPQFAGTPTVTKIDVPRHKAGDPIPPSLAKVKYWKRSEYLEAKRNAKNKTGTKGKTKENDDNTMTWYVTDEHGVAIGSSEVECVRERARACWWLLLRLGLAPVSWCKITVEASDIFEFYMASRFVKLTWGEENWKVHMIATDNYSLWHLTRKREGHTFGGPLIPPSVKLEPIDMTIDAPPHPSATQPLSSSKRRLSSTPDRENGERKRLRAAQLIPQIPKSSSTPILPSTPQLAPAAISEDNGAPESMTLGTASPPSGGTETTTEVLKKLHTELSDVFSEGDDLGVKSPGPQPMSVQDAGVVSASGGEVVAGGREGDGDGSGSSGSNAAQPPSIESQGPSIEARVLPQPAAPKKRTGDRKARGGKGNNAKSACKNAWIGENPEGKERQWEEYWESEGKALYKDWKAPNA